MQLHRICSLVAFATAFAVPSLSLANPRPLPFTYGYETLAEGDAEVEQFVDLSPLKGINALSGAPQWYTAMQFQTEFEYGISDRLELGLYLTLAPQPGETLTGTTSLTEGNGIKQRLRLRLAEEGEWPVDVGLYGEVVENDREIELEAKILLSKRIGQMRAMVNLWAEREYYFENRRDWVLNPTAGITYQVSPLFNPGIEYWMRAEFPDPAPHPRGFNPGPHHMLGPTIMLNFGKLWWSTGIYVRLDDMSRTLQPGDAYGPIWARTIIGYGF